MREAMEAPSVNARPLMDVRNHCISALGTGLSLETHTCQTHYELDRGRESRITSEQSSDSEQHGQDGRCHAQVSS